MLTPSDIKKLYRDERRRKVKPVKRGDRIRKYMYEGVVLAVSKPHATKLKVRIDKVETGDQQLVGFVWVCDNDGLVQILEGSTHGTKD